jgi:hypothetical protein
MNRLCLLLVASLVLTLAGCNAILGIERAKVVERGDDSGTPDCTDDVCVTPTTTCTTLEECPAGQACTDGVCVGTDMDGGTDAGDASADAPLDDAGEGGSEAGCTESEFRCEGTALPTRLQCVAGVWKSGAACESGQLCDSQSTPPGACKPVVDVCLGQKPGQGFCVGSDRVLCGPDLVSATRRPCGETALCSLGSGGECAACNRNDAKCEGDELHLCKSDYSGFAYSETCKAGECRANLARCTAMLCDPDAWSCSGKILEHCNATGSAYIDADRKDCGTGICDEFSGKCKTCEPNANLGCAEDPKYQLRCDADGANKLMRACTEDSSATPICVGAGVCVQCAADSKSCQDPKTAIACSGLGVATSSMCTGTTCVAGKGCTGECAPDTYKCTGSANPGRMKCGPEGMFNQSETCEAGSLCDTATGQCKPIIEGCMGQAVGATVCVGSKRITCGADMVNATSEQCGSVDLCNASTGSKCATCTSDTWECREAELWKCNAARDGMVRDQICLSQALCNANLKTCTDKKCDPNKKYCEGTILRTCNATGSAVLSSETCASGICDNTNGQCDVCPANEYLRCANNLRVRCNDTGQGETTEACGTSTPTCIDKGQCVQCTPKTDTCSADLKVATHCDDFGSRTTENCASNQTCFDGDCGGSCGPGQYQCGAIGTAARNTCGPRGTFSVAANCASGEACEASTGQCKAVHPACTGASSSGQWVCWGQQRVQCSADRLSISPGNTCDSAALCGASSGNVCAQCLTNQRRCLQAKTQKCASGQWADDVVCTSAMWCDNSTGTCLPPNCTPGTWKCSNDGKNHEQCDVDGNRWVQQGTCGWCDNTSSATASVCYSCQPNVTLGPTCANGTQQSICNTQGTSFSGTRACGPSPRTTCTGANTCVECTANTCNGATAARICTGGLYQPKDCVALNQTCFTQSNGVPDCGGICVKDKRQCSSTGNPQICSASGGWAADTNKPACASNELCEKWVPTTNAAYGTCVTNDVRVRGYSTAGGSVTEPAFNDFIATAVRLDDDYRLVRLGALTVDQTPPLPDNQGGQSLMFIYADMLQGTTHRPGALITYGTAKDLLVGGNVWSPINTTVTLRANTTYWLAIDINGAPGDQVRLWRLPATATGDGVGVIERAVKVPGTVPDPFPLATSSREANTAISLYLQVQRYWH